MFVDANRARGIQFDPEHVKSAGQALKSLFDNEVLHEMLGPLHTSGFLHPSVSGYLSQLRDTPEISSIVSGATRIYGAPTRDSRQRAIEGPPQSVSFNAGASGAFGLGGHAAQSITFDLLESRPSTDLAIYSGSTSVGPSAGFELGFESGLSVSLNWFPAAEVAGWYYGAQESAVFFAGVTAAQVQTTSGPSLVFGLAGGLDVGISFSGGYTFYEGEGLYELPGRRGGRAPGATSFKFGLSLNGRLEGYLGLTSKGWCKLDDTGVTFREVWAGDKTYYRVIGGNWDGYYLNVSNQNSVGVYRSRTGWKLEDGRLKSDYNKNALSIYRNGDNGVVYAWDKYNVLDVERSPEVDSAKSF
jgi:hypothetical protein